jgi:3-hydroxybutyryl-CoA dehydrogenase
MTEVIGVVGAGVMGRGIVQLFAQAGHEIRLYDARTGAAGDARSFVCSMLDRQVAKATLAAEQRDAMAARIVECRALADLSECDLVIEAIVEKLEPKQALFREIEPLVSPDCILVSNTSSLLISAIASACERPERVAGLHFFNPVPLMKIVEVIPGIMTDPGVADRLRALVQGAGHRAVTASDQPGFLINHAGRALYTEGLAAVAEQVTDYHGIDRIVREAMGFRMGPFELLDLTGLDVSGSVMQSIYDQFQQDPRYRPSPLVPPRLAAGLFGRKTARGFYGYAEGRQEIPEETPAPMALPKTIWIENNDRRAEISALDSTIAPSPGEAEIIFLTPWGEDISTAATRAGHDPARCVGVDPVTDFSRRRTLMVSPATRPEVRDAAHALLASDGVPVSVIADSAGFVVQRILAMIVNTGCEIAQRAIATPQDIDDAVRLGLGYPEGPLALGDRIGPKQILAILETIGAITGDPRYRPSLWLRRRALLGLPLQSG